MNNEAIQVKSLARKFGNLTAVDSISFDVHHGEVFGFLGPNGAGKSTTINMLCTILKPSHGEAFISGFDVTKDPHKVRKEIGIVFQDPSLDDRLTADDNWRFHGYMYNLPEAEIKKRIPEVLSLVELEDRRKDFVRKFSGGMKTQA